MRFLTLFLVCTGCAYGVSEQSPQVYGHYAPGSYDGGSSETSSDNGYENDMYTTGCFIQNIWGPNGQSSPPISYIVICNGKPFSVKDLIDPPPEEHHEKVLH